MSYANYLWAVSEALQAEVSPALDSDLARESLTNCIRVLTALGNALEAGSPDGVPENSERKIAPHVENLRTVIGPPESPALSGSNWSDIKALTEAIESGRLTAEKVRSSVSWEREQMDAAIDRMDRCLRTEEQPAADQPMKIDSDALQAYLRQVSGEKGLTIESSQMAIGGRSRQTMLLTISPGSGLPQELVVQRPTPGMNHGSAFSGPAAEFKILQTLYQAGLKVPKPVLLETGSDALGAPFVVVERAAGRLVDADYWAGRAPRLVALDLAKQMAKLHLLPLQPLDSFLPRSRKGGDANELLNEVARFEAGWRSNQHGPSITMSAALAWMREHANRISVRDSVIHNDMVFHNLMATDEAITAVLDWEQAAIGHPGEDLGYCYPVVSRVLPWDEFMCAYRDAGGVAIPQLEIDYFAIRAQVRLMLVVHHGRDAFETGRSRTVVMAGAGAFFAQHLMRRLGQVLDEALSRSEKVGV